MDRNDKRDIVDLITDTIKDYFEDIDMPTAVGDAHHMSQQALLRKCWQIADIVEDIYNQAQMREVEEV